MTREELETMHWTQLKKQLEEKGLQYESKEQAINALVDEVGSNAPPDQPPKTSRNHVFDAKKPHGLITGKIDGAPGARFFQDGNLYNSEGVKVG